MVTLQIIHYNAGHIELIRVFSQMSKKDLLEMAGERDFISGIYNYCDRWCERCAFTSRCFLYATEQADPDLDNPEVRDINNEKFWRKLESIFRDAAELIAEWAAENNVDPESIDVSEEMAERERELEKAEQNELSQAAHRYATNVENWFREELGSNETVHHDAGKTSEEDYQQFEIEDALEIIRWYQFLITVKLVRALSGASETSEEPDDDDDLSMDFLSGFETMDDDDVDYDEVIARTARMDANGSAKVALVAIDRSIGAWRALQISLPEKSDTIKPMLIELGALRSAAEARFPRARDFIRPGLDEALSDFVS